MTASAMIPFSDLAGMITAGAGVGFREGGLRSDGMGIGIGSGMPAILFHYSTETPLHVGMYSFLLICNFAPNLSRIARSIYMNVCLVTLVHRYCVTVCGLLSQAICHRI